VTVEQICRAVKTQLHLSMEAGIVTIDRASDFGPGTERIDEFASST
jgi:hypothetical protein